MGDVEMKGVKHDTDKPRMELLPPLALKEIAQVMTAGAKKYGDHNWLGGMKHGRLVGAALRHISSYLAGEDIDEETRTLNLANAAIDLMMVIEYTKRGLGEDDRFKK